MKSVLISIQRPHTDNIKALIKTLEVRKGKPNQPTPFPCYIYETKAKGGCGKVIGEFVCDKIDIYSKSETISKLQKEILFKKACLTGEQLYEYVFDKTFYAWHISDLKIYDKPKELSEFYVKDLQAVKQCEYRERVFTNPETTNGVCLKGSYLCNKTSDWCDNCKHKPLLKAPQSWCYVKSLEE